MKKIFAILSLILITLTSITAYAHSGRTDKNGCHQNTKTGERHCH